MKSILQFFAIAAAFVLVAFIGCASYPIAIKYIQTSRPDVTVPMVQAAPEKYTDALVIWGGIVISVVNDSMGSRLFVMETPLDDEGYPRDANLSRGRFIARTSLFLDPEIYRKGRRITLAGAITGISTERLGEGTYAYPRLNVKELRYWQFYPNYHMVYPYYSPYYFPPYGPWWYDDYFFDFDERGFHGYRGHRGFRR